MTVLALEGKGEDLRLYLNGDCPLDRHRDAYAHAADAALAQIVAHADSRPARISEAR